MIAIFHLLSGMSQGNKTEGRSVKASVRSLVGSSSKKLNVNFIDERDKHENFRKIMKLYTGCERS